MTYGYFTTFLGDTFCGGAPLPTGFLYGVALVVLALGAEGARATWPRFAPAVCYAAFFLGYRVFLLPPLYFDWYFPPFLAVFMLLVAAGLEALAKRAPRGVSALALALALLFAIQAPFTSPVERAIQRDIEESVRGELGRWLAAHVPPGEAVASESAGYVGYYSNVLLYDYPGLTSPAVLRAVRALPRERRSFADVIDALQPPWAVLRPNEVERLKAVAPRTAARYSVVKVFATSEEASRLECHGYRKVTDDRCFLVLRRAS